MAKASRDQFFSVLHSAHLKPRGFKNVRLNRPGFPGGSIT
jgi:hypothetical protein